MAIVGFWDDGDYKTSKTTSMAAIATYLAIETNMKILMINTKIGDTSLEDCFWDFKKSRGGILKKKMDLGTGLEGLSQLILSGKTDPEIIKNYTATIFKNSLEILTYKNCTDTKEDFVDQQEKIIKEILKMAEKSYNLVMFNLEGKLEEERVRNLLEASTLNIVNISQNLKEIEELIIKRKESDILRKQKTIVLLAKYDVNSKYSPKNIARYIGEKEVIGIPYNTLFLEACNEGKVPDLFINFRKIKNTDINFNYFNSLNMATSSIVNKINEIQMGY